MHVLIVGAGIIGLSIGWRLQRAKIATTILDCSAKKQASQVAAGMIAPYSEASYANQKWLQIATASANLYPHFLKELALDSGIEVALDTMGTLFLAADYRDIDWLNRFYQQKIKQNAQAIFLSGTQARALEPLLSPRVLNAVWLKNEAQLDSAFLLQALRKAFISLGGHFLPLSAKRCIKKQDKVIGIESNNGQCLYAEHVIICAGAYSSQFGAAVSPLKGEILTLKSPYSLNYMIRSPRVYITPKPNQVVRIGATAQEVGYDLSLAAGSVRTLLQEAWEIIPAVDEMSILSCETGLRPLTTDHLPLIEEINGVFYATGHGRSGILFAPYTAQEMLMKIMLNGEEKEVETGCLAELVPQQQSCVAAAINHEVIPSSQWDQTRLKEGDKVEIVTPFQGG